MSLTNDTIKKVGGTASVELSSGRRLGFTVKGVYTAKTDRTALVFAPDLESKGSVLKVTLTGSNALVQGKLIGQAIKSVSTVGPDDQ